ncbi:MAG TPA: ABC transporter permease [Candidatus Dormibacteraeota bacterium]
MISASAINIITGALYFTVGAGLLLGLAAAGELIQEKAGVLNLGLEGVFLTGALAGFYIAFRSGDVWLGYLGAALAGALVGVVFATLVVYLRLNQVIVGILVVIFVLGAANVVWARLVGNGSLPTLPAPTRVPIPLLGQIPIVGSAVFTRFPPEYLAVVVIALTAWLIQRTRFGLAVRAVGENPDAVHFSGLSVLWTRVAAVVVGCAIAGAAGGLLTIGQLGFYAPGVTAGRGWIAIAIVIIGGWSPWRTLLGALVFGAADMLQFEVQAAQWQVIPYEFLLAFPYLVAVLALVFRRNSVQPPRALGIPFKA